MIRFQLNGKKVETKVPMDTPLLWVVREEFGLRGSKFGCGKGICGSCTMHLDDQPTRSCILPIAAISNKKVNTIESKGVEKLHPVQQAWIKHSVPQCGYCQSGQVMQAIGLLESQDQWQEEDLLATMSSIICRCGTYNKIKKAVVEAAQQMGKLK